MRSRIAVSLPILLALAAAPSLPAAAAEPGWTPLGPEAGQRVVSLTVRPGPVPRIFAAGTSGVFRTVEGTRWDLVNGDGLPLGASGQMHSVPLPGSPVYLATNRFMLPSSLDGVFRSDDGGVSWTTVRGHGGRLAVAPSDPSRLYLAALPRDRRRPPRGQSRRRGHLDARGALPAPGLGDLRRRGRGGRRAV